MSISDVILQKACLSIKLITLGHKYDISYFSEVLHSPHVSNQVIWQRGLVSGFSIGSGRLSLSPIDMYPHQLWLGGATMNILVRGR